MLGVLTDYAENKAIDLVMTGAVFTPPATVYLGLLSAEPTDGSVVEVAYTNYARRPITFAAPAGRAVAQSGDVAFPQCGVTGATSEFYAIFDTETSGNPLAYGVMASALTISQGEIPTISSGTVVLTFQPGGVSDYLAHALLNHLFRATAYTAPTNRCLAMATVAIAGSDTGSTITEPAGNNYARKTSGSWTVTGGAAVNAANEDFATPTGSWGAIIAQALLDAASGGNLLFFDNNPPGKGQIPRSGEVVRVEAGAFSCTLS